MGKWLLEAFLVFVGYTVAYTFTLGFTYPMQKILLPENSLMASLFFLPHGVRAIAFFLFGVRAAIYLLPPHFVMWYITVYGAEIGLDIFSPFVSILGCTIGYLLYMVIRKFLPDQIYDKGYVLVVLIIIFTAFFNSVGLSRLHFSLYDYEHLLSYFWGDIFGGIIFLILAMYIWRILRNTRFD